MKSFKFRVLVASLAMKMFFICSFVIGQTIDPWTPEGATLLKVDYLSQEENLVIVELCKARTDPSRYATEYIEPRVAWFLLNEPYTMQEEDGRLLMTNEGKAAVIECVKAMKKTPAMGVVRASEGISKAARDHARDMELRNFFDHDGSDGADPFVRMNRYGVRGGYAGENISAGKSTAREIVIQLLVDDGVASRGHRENILTPVFTRVGVAIAPHKQWSWTATIDFAELYTEKNK